MRGRGGQIYQAGLDIRSHGAPPTGPQKGPFRAVVLNTYVTDSDGRSHRQKAVQVACDVILCRTGHRINHVPVAQPSWGENDARPWIPKETTRAISLNAALNTDTLRSSRGSYQGEVTPLDDLDGDTVLLDFIEGSQHSPMILCAIPHEQTKRIVIEGTGHVDEAGGEDYRGNVYRREAYFRHAGAEARVNGSGDVLIDTVGATDDRVDEEPTDDTGHVRVRVKESQRLTVEMDGTDVLEIWKDGDQVKIDLGEGAAQQLILGNDFRTFFNEQMQKINTFWTSRFNAHVHAAGTLLDTTTGAVTGATGVPAVTQGDSITSMSADLLSDLARTKKT